MEELTHFNKLFSINCNDKTEKKSNGSIELTYLSWCYAWSEVKKLYPNDEIIAFGKKPDIFQTIFPIIISGSAFFPFPRNPVAQYKIFCCNFRQNQRTLPIGTNINTGVWL